MTDPFELVGEFVDKFERPRGWTERSVHLAWSLIEEEYLEAEKEVWDYVPNKDISEQIDKIKLTEELADLQYVINYAAQILGLPLREVFEEKHRANLSKIGPDGRPVLREDGKILKGPNYVPPDYSRFF